MKLFFQFALILLLTFDSGLIAQDEDSVKSDKFSSAVFNGLKFRSIGPALTSGRISDFAVNPNNQNEYYVAVCSGGVWKTTNAGTTFEPIFDKEGSYSIGCIAMDPNNPSVIWVGSGENNSQRSVSYGDGIYKSEDGGKSWKNMGLKNSEHIGKILVDPRASEVVYAAAQGPLWGPGGDRGLYKTTDGGSTWNSVLTISENTGVSDLAFDPRDYDVIYATSYQRRRHVWTLIDGGPESGIHKTTDGGATWKELKSGLPSVDKGRIGITVSPVNPDLIYAIVETAADEGGFFRSADRGASWKKMNDYIASSPQYYMEIYADPLIPDRVYSMDTRSKVTDDGGKTWNNLSTKNRHVDDHALWIDPLNNNHLLIGGDGGIYETWDSCENWHYKENLPVTQFYRVSVDNAEPFYFVYGGTQDNNSLGGPSRTISSDGIMNSDWFVTNGGDGFESAIDPQNPNIVYAQSQYGWLVRYDKQSGERLMIQPQEGEGDDPYRWNWDSPLIISPHKNTRLYFAANKLFRSEDRGSSWEVISPDLTRQLDRNKLEVMGKIWSADAVSKNASTSQYGNIVSLSESPLQEGLIYTGTDDGLIQVTENGGVTWMKIDTFPGVPELTYVSCITASSHDVNTVYAAFDNHKMSDFKPYILVSNNRGKSWKSISGDLKKNLPVYSIREDFINKNLLFIGTEYGLYFSFNTGENWFQLKGGLPTIAVKDIDIQERESDLVIATFGRGFYILDDYSPLRSVNEDLKNKEAVLFPVKDALMFHEKSGFYGQGESLYKADNPPFGATFSYYIKESPKSKKQLRKEMEKELIKEGKPVPFPSWEELRAEEKEPVPYLLFTVKDQEGNVVRRLKSRFSKGISRIVWDLRYSSLDPVTDAPEKEDFKTGGSGSFVMPGKYTVTLSKNVEGDLTIIAGPSEFNTIPLENTELPADSREELVEFQLDLSDLSRRVSGAERSVNEVIKQMEIYKTTFFRTPEISENLLEELELIQNEAEEIKTVLTGDPVKSMRNTDQKPTVMGRINNAVYGLWRSTSSPTMTQRENYRLALKEFEPLRQKLKRLIEIDIENIKRKLTEAGAPWTPGSILD